MTTQSQTQQMLQNLTSAQTNAQPNSGAVNNGNPGTVYNVPPQANAAGQWWNPPQQGNPLMNNILNNTFGRYPPGATPTPGTPTPTTPPPGGNVPLPTGGAEINIGPGGPNGYFDGGGGEGAWCVSAEMLLEGSVKAGKAVAGLVATTHTPEEGFDLHAIENVGAPIAQPCVMIVTDKNAMLVCSVSTPFTMVGAQTDDQTILAPAMLGEMVYVRRGKKVHIEKVTTVIDAGVQLVVPISFGGRSFPAGVTKDALIYSHNMRKVEGQGVDLVGLRDNLSQRFGNSFGSTEYITTASQLQAMAPGAASMYAGGNAYLPGGNLYTGGNVPLPGGTAPTGAPGEVPAPNNQITPYDPNAIQQMPKLPNPYEQNKGFWGGLLQQLVPHDADGSVDWQGLLLEAVGGPAARLIDTSD